MLLAECGEAGIYGAGTELFFNAQEAIVFGNPFASVGRTRLDLVGIQSDGEIRNGRVFRFARTVGDDGRVARVGGEFHGIERFRECADLVELNENGVAAVQTYPLGEALCIRNEEVVSYELHLVAERGSQPLPAVPIFFIQAVFNGIDGIFFYEFLPVGNEFVGSILLAALGQDVFTGLGTLPFTCRRVKGETEVGARFVAGFFYILENVLNGFFIARKIGREAAFVADGGSQPFFFQEGCEDMEDFRAPAQTFGKGRCTGRHNHKFLDVHRVGRVGTAV